MKSKFKLIRDLFFKHSTRYIILIYFLINLVFMRTLWNQIFFDHSTVGAVYGEIYAVEWNMEKLYQNIIQFKNPFTHSESMFYPFGTNFIATDSGTALFFVFLRPFLSTHQSLYILTAIALFLANVGMYLLLRILRVNKLTSFLIGLAFGYMTFIHPRLGHITYFFFYPFPWFYFCVLTIYQHKNTFHKIVAAIIAGLLLTLTLYLNLYFFVSLLLSIGFFLAYFVIFERRLLLKIVKSHYRYGLLILVSSLLFLSPWLKVFYETYKFEELPKAEGWAGAIEFSSDLFGYFIPSGYSIFLKPVAVWWGIYFPFTRGIFENFSYPGMIILGSFLILVPLWYFKKISSRLKKRISPFFWASFGFWILTLGPFLHVLGKWGITVDDGIRIVAPLPYILFHYLPFMSNIRSPGRLMPAFIFFAYIVSAFIINYFIKTKSPKFKSIFYAVLVISIIIDHYVVVPNPPPHFLPKKIYEYIRSDPRNITVMEMPSVVRDGFTYFGDLGSLDYIQGQPFHGKNILGGYMGRFPHYKRDYYVRNPFLGYMGRLMDIDIKNNGSLERTPADLKKWEKIDIKRSIDTIDFLDLAYILVNTDFAYAKKAETVISSLGYTLVNTEKQYHLWYRKPKAREFISVKVGSLDDDVLLAQGWNTREAGFRWAGKKTSVMFKLAKNSPQQLYFTAAAFHKPQSVTIYQNKQKIGKVELDTSVKTHSVSLIPGLKDGINTFTFIFDTYYIPAEIISGSDDRRQIAAKYTEIYLK